MPVKRKAKANGPSVDKKAKPDSVTTVSSDVQTAIRTSRFRGMLADAKDASDVQKCIDIGESGPLDLAEYVADGVNANTIVLNYLKCLKFTGVGNSLHRELFSIFEKGGLFEDTDEGSAAFNCYLKGMAYKKSHDLLIPTRARFGVTAYVSDAGFVGLTTCLLSRGTDKDDQKALLSVVQRADVNGLDQTVRARSDNNFYTAIRLAVQANACDILAHLLSVMHPDTFDVVADPFRWVNPKDDETKWTVIRLSDFLVADSSARVRDLVMTGERIASKHFAQKETNTRSALESSLIPELVALVWSYAQRCCF